MHTSDFNASLRFLLIFLFYILIIGCLCLDNTETTQPILINFSLDIVLTLEKNIDYFYLQKYILKGIK